MIDDYFFLYRRLKPLGLNLLLNANCGVLKGRELIEQHRKYSSLYINAKTKPARQSKPIIIKIYNYKCNFSRILN